MIIYYAYEDGKEGPIGVFLEEERLVLGDAGYIQFIEINPWDVKQWDERVDHLVSSWPS